MEWIFTFEFIVMVETKTLEFLNGGEIKRYDDWEVMVQ